MEIISLLRAVHREGMDNVLAYLENSDYFTTHCHHHHRYKGGLAEHSLGVYFEMITWAPELSDDSCRIVALLHDLCTSHLEGYNDIGRLHHGQRSVELLDALGLKLHDDERLAISRHMHHVPESELSESTALWHYLHFCDRRSASYHLYPVKQDLNMQEYTAEEDERIARRYCNKRESVMSDDSDIVFL